MLTLITPLAGKHHDINSSCFLATGASSKLIKEDVHLIILAAIYRLEKPPKD
jgi:hypothetical protein